jgi:hypothetical protein
MSMNTYCNKLLVLVGCNVDGTKPSIKTNHDFNINWAPRVFLESLELKVL